MTNSAGRPLRVMMARTLVEDDLVIPSDGIRPGRERMELYSRLMLDAYSGTIDDEGETLDDARSVVQGLFEGEFGELDVAATAEFVDENALVAATFVTVHHGRPLVAFSMTSPGHVRRGLARRGLRHAIGELARAGWHEVTLVVTEGNEPAETLYVSEGFSRVRRDEP